MSGPIQTVNFIPPAQIQALTQQVTPTGIVTPSVISTGAVSALGDVTSGLISMRALQDAIYNLQANINPVTPLAGSMNTQSYYGANTVPNQSYRAAIDDYSSKHVYDQGGLSSDNIQYLQVDSNANIPSALSNEIIPSFFQNASGTYMIGSSQCALYFTGSVGGYVGTAQGSNRNRLTRREQFNLLQDIGQLTGTYAGGYTGFSSAWNSGLIQVADVYSQSATIFSEANLLNAQTDANIHTWGNYGWVWRYDTATKQVIARSVPNMTQTLWGTGSNVWKNATVPQGWITSIGNGWFSVPIINPSTYGILVFDIDLNPITIMQASAYAGPLSGVAGIDPLKFNTQAGTYKTFEVQTDQIRGAIVKRFGFNQLGTGTYTDLSTGQQVDVFSGNTGSQATFLYVSSSSQASYNASEAISNGTKGSMISPLSTAKWDNSQGKLICWALCTGAVVGPPSPSYVGTIASANGWRLVPIAIYRSSPDDYLKGDTLSVHSFTYDSLLGITKPLTILYPIVDIRDEQVYCTGAFRSQTGTFFASEFTNGMKQTTISTGGNFTGATSGIQTFAISVCCMTGSDNSTAYLPYGYGSTTIPFPRNKRHWEDLYGQYYYQYTDATGTYFQQNWMMDGIIQLSDIKVKWYASATSQPFYVDDLTGKRYYQQIDGTYKDAVSGGAVDPSINASLRQAIMNNGFVIRHVYAQYSLRQAPTGSGNVTNGTYTAPMNPIPPPVSSANNNSCPTPVFADFDMPDGTVFDSTAIYASEPFDLTYIDWSSYTGTVGGSAAGVWNDNFGSTGLYDANNIKALFNFAQLGLSANVVDVKLPGEAYTGAGNGKTGNVPAGKVVFEVKGEVFNGQPMKMTFQTGSAGNAILTEFQAKQLNYYGGGLYGNTSLWQESNGESHIMVGHSNSYYVPFSETFESNNYVARRFIQDLQTTGALASIISARTLRKLGLDNVQATPGPTLRTSYTKINDGIYNANGKYIMDCTRKGVIMFLYALQTMVRGTSASNPIPLPVVDQITGVDSTVGSDKVGAPYAVTMWKYNAYGEIVTLNGSEFKEAWALAERLIGYFNSYLSNRYRGHFSNLSTMINARTMRVEQVIRSRINYTSFFTQASRDQPGVIDYFWYDYGVNNEDEVEGIPTSGSKYMAQKSKRSIKMWKIQDMLRSLAVPISNGSNRPRFALQYDGSLGAQPAISATGSALPYTDNTYGCIGHFSTVFYNIANLAGGMAYAGKQGGKDCFVYTVQAQMACAYNAQAGGYPTVVMSNTKRLNVPKTYEKGIIPKWSDDGQVITFAGPPISGQSFTTMANAATVNVPFATKEVGCFTMNDNETDIINNWSSIFVYPNHPELQAVTGPAGAVNYTSMNLTRAAQNYSRSNGILVNSTILVVNDLAIVGHGDKMSFFKLDTGEEVANILSDDFDWDEVSLPDYMLQSNNNIYGSEVHGLGAPAYMNGQFYILGGGVGRQAQASVGRNISRFNIKVQTPITMNLQTLFATGSSTVCFSPQDALAQNGGMFCLLTTFKTTDYYNVRKPEYASVDSNYDNLFLSGITAIGVYIPSDVNLGIYQVTSLDLSTKFVNGGSWFERTNISFKSLLDAGYVKFLYAGQIPYKCAAQTPFIVSEDQRQEAVMARRQKRLLQEYLRTKNGSTAPYPDNGCYVENNTTFINSVKFKPYYDWIDPKNSSTAVIYNQSLGYTDVSTGRPLPTPL